MAWLARIVTWAVLTSGRHVVAWAIAEAMEKGFEAILRRFRRKQGGRGER